MYPPGRDGGAAGAIDNERRFDRGAVGKVDDDVVRCAGEPGGLRAQPCDAVGVERFGHAGFEPLSVDMPARRSLLVKPAPPQGGAAPHRIAPLARDRGLCVEQIKPAELLEMGTRSKRKGFATIDDGVSGRNEERTASPLQQRAGTGHACHSRAQNHDRVHCAPSRGL